MRDGRLTCDGVQGSNRQQRNDSQVDVQAEGLVDENGAGEHVRLRGEGSEKNDEAEKLKKKKMQVQDGGCSCISAAPLTEILVKM